MRSSRALWTKKLVRISVFLLLVVGVSPWQAGPVSAWAQNKQDGCLKDVVCHDHYYKALKLYDDGKYADALPEFQAAYQRRQMPWLMLNVGRTMQRLGRPQEAIDYYERYKKAELNMEPATLERVNKYIEQAQALIDKPAGETPNPPNLTVKDPGPANPPTGTGTQLVLTPGQEGPPPPKPVYKKWWFWTIIGVAVAGGIAGAVAGSLAAQKSPPPSLVMPGDPVFMPKF